MSRTYKTTCPTCGSHDAIGHYEEHDDLIYQDIVCPDCGFVKADSRVIGGRKLISCAWCDEPHVVGSEIQKRHEELFKTAEHCTAEYYEVVCR